MLAMQVNQLTVVCFPSLPSNRVAGLEPPPPHLLTPVSGRVSKHQQACARCVRGNEPKGGCCCERAGRRRSERMENREESGVCVWGGWSEMSIVWQVALLRLLGLFMLWLVLSGCVHKRANIPPLPFPNKVCRLHVWSLITHIRCCLER